MSINNFEDIIKNKFDKFEADIDPSIWENINNNISNKPNFNNTNSVKDFLLKNIKTISYTLSSIGIIATTVVIYNIVNSNNIQNNIEPNTEIVSVINDSIKDNNDNSENINNEINVINNEENKVDNNNNVNLKETENLSKTNEPKLNNKNESISGALLNKQTVSNYKTNENIVLSQQNLAQTSNSIVNTKNCSSKNNEKEIVENCNKTKSVNYNYAKIETAKKSGTAPLNTVLFNVNHVYKSVWEINGKKIEGNNISYTFEKPGNYIVKVCGYDEQENYSVDTIHITAKVNSYIEPKCNIFTPNYDGNNDKFEYEYKNIESFFIFIVDRNGRKVFESKQIDDFWDGKDMKGNEVPNGVYFYMISATGIGNYHLPPISKSITVNR